MTQTTTPAALADLTLPASRRSPAGPRFYRVCEWSDQVREGLWQFHELARARGMIQEGRIPNPDEGQIARLNEVLGGDFVPDAAFAEQALVKWMPRMSPRNRRAFAAANAAMKAIYLCLGGLFAACLPR